MSACKQPEPKDAPRVHVVIPTYNRLASLERCLGCLERQAGANLRIIVVDGGSAADVVDRLRPLCEAHTLLLTRKPRYWGGAMQAGIAHVLAEEAPDRDFILMVNDDVMVADDFVATLVQDATAYGAALSAICVDKAAPSKVIDAGVKLDWHHYSFYRLPTPDVGSAPSLDVDVLAARGTIVPIGAIRKAGNVDARGFPHYVADYDFSMRLHRVAGIPLGVCRRAVLRVDMTSTGMATPRNHRASALRRVQDLISRRSKNNLADHTRFILRHAPPHLRWRLVRKVMGDLLSLVLRDLFTGPKRACASRAMPQETRVL